MMKFIGELSQKHYLRVANVFHAGDGNLHPLVLYDSRNEGELRKAEEMGKEIIKACIEMGGTLTGEHGIGVEKRDYMPMMYTDDDLEAMRKVKRAFNADGLLNPGKIFPTKEKTTTTGPPSQQEILDRVFSKKVKES
jgi:glycolate oxidase